MFGLCLGRLGTHLGLRLSSCFNGNGPTNGHVLFPPQVQHLNRRLTEMNHRRRMVNFFGFTLVVSTLLVHIDAFAILGESLLWSFFGRRLPMIHRLKCCRRKNEPSASACRLVAIKLKDPVCLAFEIKWPGKRPVNLFHFWSFFSIIRPATPNGW